MGEQIFKGIRSEEILDCGCILKRYISGLNVIDPEDKAQNVKILIIQALKNTSAEFAVNCLYLLFFAHL